MTRSIVAVTFCAALVAASACGASTPTSNSRSSLSPTVSSERVRGNLDPVVSMPASFPADVPIYSGARLTSAINFGTSGTTTWGMEWETLDGVEAVQAFYTARLGEGDWSMSFPSNANGAFSATFNRKSNPKVGGILGIDGSSGITKISLALTNGG